MNAIADMESRGLLLYESERYDLHPVVRGVVAESLQPEDRSRFGKQVVDHFSSMAHNPYEQAETLEDLSGGLQLVRTLVKIRKFHEAWISSKEGWPVPSSLIWKRTQRCCSSIQALLPSGWSTLPTSVIVGDASWSLLMTLLLALEGPRRPGASVEAYSTSLENRTYAPRIGLGCCRCPSATSGTT